GRGGRPGGAPAVPRAGGGPPHRRRPSPDVIPLRDANPTRGRPVVTLGLIALCVVAFAYELGGQAAGGAAALDRLFRDWALVPRDLTNALDGAAAPGTLGRELGTVVTSMFLHGGWIHLIGNMLYLWIFG